MASCPALTSGVVVKTVMPSVASRVQEVWSFGIFSTLTRHIRHAPSGGHAVVVAEDGDLDAGPPGGVVDGRPLRHGDRPPVDGQRDRWWKLAHRFSDVIASAAKRSPWTRRLLRRFAPRNDRKVLQSRQCLNITAPCLDMVFIL